MQMDILMGFDNYDILISLNMIFMAVVHHVTSTYMTLITVVHHVTSLRKVSF